jgi:cytochrome P450
MRAFLRCGRSAPDGSSENAQSPFRPPPPAVERVLGSGLTARSGLLGHNPPDHTRLRSFVKQSVHPDGDGLDVCRPGVGRHVAFGHGIHFCLGAPLARLEAQVVLQELTATLPEARLVEPQEVLFSRNTTFRSPLQLLVEWSS